MFKSKIKRGSSSVGGGKSSHAITESLADPSLESSSFSPSEIRNNLSTYFIEQASNKLYPENNVHVYAYRFKKEIGAQNLTDCTLLIDYQTGKQCKDKCLSEIDTQNVNKMLCKINRFILLDTNLCFCPVQKSKRDKGYILAFFNVTDEEILALLVMFDFYKMMAGEDDPQNLKHLYNYVQERTFANERACRHVATKLEAHTFKKALEMF